MSIVYGTDFSEPASRAGKVAALLAARRHTELDMMHVLPAEGLEEDPAKDAAMRRAAAKLRAEAGELGSLGQHVRTDVLTGLPDEALPVLAEGRKAELLVIGALGRRPPSRWKLGTTAERAAQAAAIPTLVVRDARPFEAWYRGERSLRVVVAVDFSRRSDAALAWVASMRALGPMDVTVLHVYSPGLERERLGLSIPVSLAGPNPELEGPTSSRSYRAPRSVSLAGPNPELEEVISRQLSHRVWGPGGPGDLKLEVRPGSGRPSDHLVQEAEALRADLIVVGTHRREGLDLIRHGSVARGVLHGASVSVAVVPGPGPEPEERIRRLLVGVDFTPASERAVRLAFSLAGPGSTVWLVHVRKRGEHAAEPHLLRGHLRRMVPAKAEKSGVTVDVQVVDASEPAEALRQCAEQADADLVCLGTRGHSGLAGSLMGSVSQALVASSNRPVLLVKAKEE
ncbi:MAG TPA: universal stress protein [Myxococcaceae bacterium]|jgi:nucleotide-binding universal stress UspA family protein